MDDKGEPLLAIEHLRLGFGRVAPAVVDDVSFEVRPGETVCLVGESGCGKSVTSLAIMGLLPTPPARVLGGSVRFDGRDLLDLTPRAMADLRGDRLAMIFQEPMTSLNPAFTVGEQIAESVRRHRGATRGEARAVALERLRQVGIPAPERRLDEYPHQLSGGMRQRIMIAMALANRPRLLIADEPTTALDVTIQAQILDLLRDLQAATGMGLLLITHDLAVVAEMADRVAIMYAGRIAEIGPVEAVFEDPQHPYTLGLMSSMPTLAAKGRRLGTVPGVIPTANQLPDGCRFASRCPFQEPACHTERPAFREMGGTHYVACRRVPLEAHVGVDVRTRVA